MMNPGSAIALSLLIACTRPNPEYCETNDDCPSGLQCEVARHTCVPSLDAATLDGSPDATRLPAFDVAYPREWKFSVGGPVSGYVLIVNTSNAVMPTASLALKSISDDHPTAVVRVTVTGFDAAVYPGHAAGALSGFSQMLLVDSGLVSEPRVETTSDYLTLEIGNAPEDTYDIQVELVLSLDNVDVMMPMTLHMVPGPEVWANPQVAARVTAYR